MVLPPRPQPAKRGSMRPPPRPNTLLSTSTRSESPAESISSGNLSRCQSPNMSQGGGMKRKERDFEQDMGEETSINVVVRCRGRNSREVKENSGVVVSVPGLKSKEVELSMGPNALSNKTYQFDKVFSPAADQAIIFDDVVRPVLHEMLSGYNCTIFAYGQTGTGKTYTMSGEMEDTMGMLSDAAGIIPRVLSTLFQKLDEDQVECAVKCSFIELYNESLRDLLAADDGTKLKIYDDHNKKGHGATMVQGMEESHIKSANDGIKLLQAGSHKRQVAATKCNDLSSRSHTVFTITTFIKKAGDAEEDFVCAGKLNLVDLAGSENIQRSGAENKRAAEAGLINKSLLTLGRVINALVDRNAHIPYRESKLTRLLQDSLGGRTKTCIIATVSPAKSNLEETISTLDYAFRAKNIRNKPQVNSMISKKTLLKEFTTEIEKLKSELIATRQRNGVYLTNEQFEEMTVESESRRILADEQKARIETLETSLRNKVQDLFSLTSTFNSLKRDNDATRLALENDRDVLAKTELVLHDTEGLLAEERESRIGHEKTEMQLQEFGTGLINQLNESTSDLGGLHSKLDRRSVLHDLNRRNWESSAARLAQMDEMIDKKMREFQDAQGSKLCQLRARTEQALSSEVERIASETAFLKTKHIEHGRIHSQITEQNSKSHHEMNQVLEEIKVLREEVKEKVGQGLQGLSAAAARISGEVIAEMEQFYTQLHLSFSALGRDFKSIFEDVVRHATSQREEIEELQKQVQEADENILVASTAASSSLARCLADERQAAEEDREHLHSQIRLLINESSRKQESRIASRIDGTRAQLLSSCSDFERAEKDHAEGMNRWRHKDSSFTSDIVKARDSIKGKMKKDWMDVSSRNSAIQTTTKAVHHETVKIVDTQLQDMAVQMAALDDFVTRARAQNEQHQELQRENVDELSRSVRTTVDHIDGTLQTTSNSIQSHVTSSVKDIETVQDGLLSPLRQNFHEPIRDFHTHFRSQPHVEYVATGETPQKKEYSYPKSLPRTELKDGCSEFLGTRSAIESCGSRSPNKETTTTAVSPRKGGLSPRKIQSSPTKLPSPTKTRVFVDQQAAVPALSGEAEQVTRRSAEHVFGASATDSPTNQESAPSTSTSHQASNQRSTSIAARAGLREIDKNIITSQPSAPLSSSSSSSSLSEQKQQHQQPSSSLSRSTSSSLSSQLSTKNDLLKPPLVKRHTSVASSGGGGSVIAPGVENANVASAARVISTRNRSRNGNGCGGEN